ncbi:Polygalacturonase [Handroanthus impetiginosus]|uniref:endo-polygalacturonase n=1 Tax=Handroanthus impetiginosus TaxID=429701 RepID=A0A2G9IBN3_9LAMI|nr:Polygalacturonase [Handroanthus impetiginosus]
MRPIRSTLFVTFLMIMILLCSCSWSCFGRKVNRNSCNCCSSKHYSDNRKNTHANRHAEKAKEVAQVYRVMNVEDFGARADGKTDNFQAFKKAWDKACNSLKSAKVLVPKGKTYYVKHINFTGPCHSGISMEIQGTIKSFPQMYDIPRRLWIKFEDVTNMNIYGGGTIDGNGEVWWKNSCKIKKKKPCQSQSAPTALTFNNCTNLRVSNLKVLNAQQMQVSFQDCNDVTASGLSVIAPESSPNTDGIHVTRTTNINILDSEIRTGDDCVSIVNGSRTVGVRNVVCGPGHGISIGSLGEDHSENYVSDIFVKGVKMTGTTNGVRIKTWQGGRGSASNIVFEDIEMKDVSNPIIINQYYCDKNKKCDKEKSAVQVKNVVYRNIRGTSASKVAINFNCSESVPCRNLILENVKLSAQEKGEKVEAFCRQIAMHSVKEKNSIPSC